MIYRKIIIIIAAIILSTQSVCFASNDSKDISDKILAEYADLYGNSIDNGLNRLEGGNPLENLSENLNTKELFNRILSGNLNFSPKKAIHFLVKLIMGEVYSCIKKKIITKRPDLNLW